MDTKNSYIQKKWEYDICLYYRAKKFLNMSAHIQSKYLTEYYKKHIQEMEKKYPNLKT